ncbi:hypothetical protein F5Y18DRAFT_277825 [Xylariaceae sp. FL1019]|nr:hypothetical protein F5Y18DRAFT_277825 [Xylariaceae sp. FL1019]
MTANDGFTMTAYDGFTMTAYDGFAMIAYVNEKNRIRKKKTVNDEPHTKPRPERDTLAGGKLAYAKRRSTWETGGSPSFNGYGGGSTAPWVSWWASDLTNTLNRGGPLRPLMDRRLQRTRRGELAPWVSGGPPPYRTRQTRQRRSIQDPDGSPAFNGHANLGDGGPLRTLMDRRLPYDNGHGGGIYDFPGSVVGLRRTRQLANGHSNWETAVHSGP